MRDSPLIPIVLIVGVAFLLYTGASGRASERGKYVPLKPTDNPLQGVRSNGDRPDATLTVNPPGSPDSWTLALFDGNLLYEPREQAERPAAEKWNYTYRLNRYTIDYTDDVGAWVGFRVAKSDGSEPDRSREVGLDVGLRYSPVRLAYGVVSPDILASPRQAGIGISIYPPTSTVHPALQHFGVGVAYLADYHGGAGWSPYLSLSTRF